MGIIERYLERRGFVREAVQKTAGFMELETQQYPAGRVEAETAYSYKDFIDAFRQLPWIYAAFSATAIAAMKAKLKVYHERKNEKVEILGEPVNKVIARPNPFWSYREFMQVNVINLMSTGNHFWNLVGTSKDDPVEISQKNPPVELWWVKPESMTVLAGDAGEVAGYEYTGPMGKPKKLSVSEIIHFRLPNPDSYFLGLGMIAPAKMAAVLEFNAQAYNRNFLENDGTPPALFTHPGNPSPEQRKEFWDAWDKRHKGPKKAGRWGMVWGGMDVKTLGTSPKDAQYIEMRKMNREEILACAGVPPSIVGLLEYANYSNMEIQSRKFWEDTVIPILNIIADKLTVNLGPHFGDDLVFEFDYSDVKALQENEEGRARTANLLIGSGLKTPNQLIREWYKGEGYEGGDTYYVGMSLVPVGLDAKARAAKRIKAAERRGTEPEGRRASFWRENEERAKAYWTAFEKRVSAKERALAPDVEKYLKDQAEAVRSKISKYQHLEDVAIAQIFDIEAEVKSYAKKFEGRYAYAFEKAKKAGDMAAQGKLYILEDDAEGKAATITPDELSKLQAQISKGAQHFNETTWSKLKDDLVQAKAESWTVTEAAQKIGDHLESLAPFESRRIARTEMARTENWGGIQGYKENEFVNMKGWMCSFVPASRDAHMAEDGIEVPIDGFFAVAGDQLEYPGDQSGKAENVINCLCTTYPVVGGSNE